MTDLPLTLQDAAKALRAKQVTSVELTTAMLRKAKALNPELGAFIVITEESAMAASADADAKFAAGIDLSPLQGIPFCTKDNIATYDAPTTANSTVLDPAWGEGWDAPVVARLRAAGGVHMGKTVLSEFACGLPDVDKTFPIPQNPWDLRRSAAGSSSGTGIAVSAGLVYCGLGTDTGGSIRAPGSFNGHSAIKATFGRVPKSGCVPLGYSLDNIGPHGRSAWDCAAMLGVIAGYDASDPSAANEPIDNYLAALDGNVKGLRIGLPMDYFFENPGPDPDTKAAVLAAVDALRDAGAVVTEISLPYAQQAKEATTIGWGADAFAYHRDDLVKDRYAYGKYTWQTLVRGAFYMGSDYVQAARVRTYWRRMVADVMKGLDVIITPTSAVSSPIRADMDTESFMLGPGFTSQFNATGQPALSIPVGFSSDTHMPLSMQIVGKPFAEATVFKVADAYQRGTDWHLQVPPIAAEVMA
ncbi:MAG TPA: amidase [Tepidiformaceae bacterium]|nr:amidase [Tepidiformaceae bacterium]